MTLLIAVLLACGFTSSTGREVEVQPTEPEASRSFVSTLFPAPPDRVSLPTGKAVVRECYGRDSDEDRYASPSGGAARKSRSSSGRGAAQAPSAGPSASTGSASPMVMAAPPAPAADSASLGGATMAEQARMAPAEPAKGASAEKKAEALADPSSRADDGLARGKKDAEREEATEMVTRTGTDKKQPDMDWGATVYLSNDDSMSLASAQRVLYAVQNNVRFSASEIRPHELLNYFSFDTAKVSSSEMFSVMASASRTGDDTLSVALAVKGATPPRLPLDLTLVVDRSGSMSAEGRMEYVKRALNLVDGNLQRGDCVDLVLFDHEVCTPLEDFVVGRDDKNLLREAIPDMAPRGSTDLDSGLKEGYRLATSHAGQVKARNHRVMVLTDALLNTGRIDENVVSEIGKGYESHDIRLTGVGVGREFNDTMLDKLTEKGKGGYVYLGSGAVVDRIFGAGFESLTRTIAHDVKFALDLPDSLAMERFYGEESSTNPDDVQPINYYAGTSQVFLQDLKVREGRLSDKDDLKLEISYVDATTGKPAKQLFQTSVGALLDSDPRNLRKARALMSWTDVLIARTMGADPCGEAFQTFRSRLEGLEDDAEIAFVDGLVASKCEAAPVARIEKSGVQFKVRLDSDIPIAEVSLACNGEKDLETLGSGQNVAVFETRPGTCQLVLSGATDMKATVSVPATGGTVRCLVRGGRLTCS